LYQHATGVVEPEDQDHILMITNDDGQSDKFAQPRTYSNVRSMYIKYSRVFMQKQGDSTPVEILLRAGDTVEFQGTRTKYTPNDDIPF
jgi:hypothetical protein